MGQLKKSFIPDLDPGAYVALAIAVMVIPLRWVISWVAAAAIHELFHFWTIRLVGGHVNRISIRASGAQMESYLPTIGAEISCAFAGPVGGLCLLLLARWMPRLALCGLIQSIYNLIPVYPLDGGRVLGGLLRWLLPHRAQKAMEWVHCLLVILISGVCLYGTVFMDLGLLPLVFAFALALRTWKIKIPCKAAPLRVQ